MKKLTLSVLIGLCLVVYGLVFFNIPLPFLRAAPSNSIETGDVTEESRIVIHTGVSDIGLYSPRGFLYQTQNSGVSGAAEFLNRNPEVENEQVLPHNFLQTARMFRQNQTGNQTHYFYQQTINGLPVYGSQFALHQQSGNEIYSMQGNITTDTVTWSGSLTQEEAKTIALTEARKSTTAELQVTAVNTMIFNGLAIGINEDPNNYVVHVVTVESVNMDDAFARTYFVSTVDGRILFSEDLMHEALNRRVNYCNNSPDCNKSRYEGDPVKGIEHVDFTYDTLGTYYNFIKNSFNRDSYDGNGGAFVANVDFNAPNNCPNAWSEGQNVYLCRELVAQDVISHEFTHSMSHSGPDFVYANQSGAIDEALADIFASAIDNNWTMGETTPIGIVRSLEDPAKYGQPDRLFSSKYICTVGEDQGGVHSNGGILGKAFYLMVNGGSFNGCTITGVGKDKAYAIIYKAEMSYMTASTNYKTVYNAITQACGDLYGGPDSADCIQVRNSLRAVEMDQQTDGAQKSPVCNGGQAKQPECTAGPNPTTPPQPTTPQTTGTPTAGPTSPSTPTSAPQSVTFQLKIRLQGVFAKPANATPVSVKVRLTGQKMQTPVAKTIAFNWMDGGTLLGNFTIENVTPGEGYVLYVKGPLHLERKICDTGPIEIFEGKYTCNGNTLTLKTGVNEIDATGILQLAGDIPDESGKQDDIINSYDLAILRNSVGTKDANLIKRLDINYDGLVDAKDFDLANLSSGITLEK